VHAREITYRPAGQVTDEFAGQLLLTGVVRQALRGARPRRALAAVAAAGPAAVPALAVALREGDGPVRRAAALALGYMPPHALPVAADLAAALGALGPQAARARPHPARALGDPDARVRRAAAEALANVGPQAVREGG
jgi:HEAT repeat protein